MKTSFPSVKVKDLELQAIKGIQTNKGRLYHTDDIIENLEYGFIENRATHEKIPIQGLRLLTSIAFPDKVILEVEKVALENSEADTHYSEAAVDSAATAGGQSSPAPGPGPVVSVSKVFSR